MKPKMFHTTAARSAKSMLKDHKKVLKTLPCQKQQPVTLLSAPLLSVCSKRNSAPSYKKTVWNCVKLYQTVSLCQKAFWWHKSAKERQGTNGCTGSSLSPHSSTAARPFILQLLLGLILKCHCQPWVFQVVLLFPGFNPWREAVKPTELFVLQSHVPRASTCKWRKAHLAESWRVSPPSAWAFPSGHFSVCCTNSFCPHQALCLSSSLLHCLHLQSQGH